MDVAVDTVRLGFGVIKRLLLALGADAVMHDLRLRLGVVVLLGFVRLRLGIAELLDDLFLFEAVD